MTKEEFKLMEDRCPQCGMPLIRVSHADNMSTFQCSAYIRGLQRGKKYCSNAEKYEVQD